MHGDYVVVILCRPYAMVFSSNGTIFWENREGVYVVQPSKAKRQNRKTR